MSRSCGPRRPRRFSEARAPHPIELDKSQAICLCRRRAASCWSRPSLAPTVRMSTRITEWRRYRTASTSHGGRRMWRPFACGSCRLRPRRRLCFNSKRWVFHGDRRCAGGLIAARRKVREYAMVARALASTSHPVLVQIVPTRFCNLSCAYCNEYDKVSEPVPLDEMLRRIDDLGRLGTAMIGISGGEPLTHPRAGRHYPAHAAGRARLRA